MTDRVAVQKTDFLWLEITGRCQLECSHCYAESGPAGQHGAMTADDWRSVIDQAAVLGVSMVQFIGGEPTTHPRFGDLLGHAIGSGLAVEVYTNLVRVRDSWWDLFSCPNVSLATSYYSSSPAEHDAITGRRGSYLKTRANIAEAVRRGIPLRAGIVGINDDQEVQGAYAELGAMGVRDIGVDYLREVGRGVRSHGSRISQLCGNCGRGVAAISPAGDVWPCVFSRWMTAGNVLRSPLADILAGQVMSDAVALIPDRRSQRCSPPPCSPDSDGNDCRPAVQPSMCTPHSCNPNRPCNPDSNDGCRPSACRPAR
jgi:MoaA/NifB/PqqE/SkfB family radical SAM enzyme